MALSTHGPRLYDREDYLTYADAAVHYLTTGLAKVTRTEEHDLRRADEEAKKIEFLKLFKQIIEEDNQPFTTTVPPSQQFKKLCTRVVIRQIEKNDTLVKRRTHTSLLRSSLLRKSITNPRVSAITLPQASGAPAEQVYYQLSFSESQLRYFLIDSILKSRPKPQRELQQSEPQPEPQPYRLTDVIFAVLAIIIAGAHIHSFLNWLHSWF